MGVVSVDPALSLLLYLCVVANEGGDLQVKKEISSTVKSIAIIATILAISFVSYTLFKPKSAPLDDKPLVRSTGGLPPGMSLPVSAMRTR